MAKKHNLKLIRQQAALNLSLEGLNVKQIAEKMRFSEITIKSYLRAPAVEQQLIESRKAVIKKARAVLERGIEDVSQSLVDIALEGRSEMARYRACIYILSCAGIQPPKVSILVEKRQISIMKKIIRE